MTDVADVSQDSPVTAVLVTFNSAAVIGQSLSALRTCLTIYKTIVVDNASTDGTATLIRDQFPEVEMIANAKNVGFGTANNQGLERVSTEFAFVLNPDAIVTPESISSLIQVAQRRKNAAIIGPLLIESSADASRKVRTGSVWEPEKNRIPPNADFEAEFLVGAAMFMRMLLVRKSGFFDPGIFLFYEDDDICRAARKAGYSLVLTSKAVVRHLVGQSTPPKPEIVAFKQCHFTWSRLYIEQKEHGGQAARQLANKQLQSLARKRLFARLTLNSKKLNLLRARTWAVECFLDGEQPSRNPADFAESIAPAGAGQQLLRSEPENTRCV